MFPKKLKRKLANGRPDDQESDYGTDAPGIWFARYNEEGRYLHDHKLMIGTEKDWKSKKIGAGPPPIKKESGWLLFYHGFDEKSVYRAGGGCPV